MMILVMMIVTMMMKMFHNKPITLITMPLKMIIVTMMTLMMTVRMIT